MTEKHCKACNRTKTVSEFYKDSATRDGYRGECKSCRIRRQTPPLVSDRPWRFVEEQV